MELRARERSERRKKKTVSHNIIADAIVVGVASTSELSILYTVSAWDAHRSTHAHEQWMGACIRSPCSSYGHLQHYTTMCTGARYTKLVGYARPHRKQCTMRSQRRTMCTCDGSHRMGARMNETRNLRLENALLHPKWPKFEFIFSIRKMLRTWQRNINLIRFESMSHAQNQWHFIFLPTTNLSATPKSCTNSVWVLLSVA